MPTRLLLREIEKSFGPAARVATSRAGSSVITMTTIRPIAQPPNTLAALGFAVGSTFAFAWLMSEGGDGVIGGVKFVAVLASIALSTRYSIRTYRRLADLEFQSSHLLRWLPLLLALAANVFTCFMIAGIAVIAIGVTLTGRGIAG